MLNDTRMLVVDDEEVICHSCRRLFSRQGFRVETSSDALEGLSLAISNDYAVILLDIKMPVLDGIQFLQALRKTKPDVPVILVTGYPSAQTRATAERLGATDYVSKPFTPEQITRAVQERLNHSPKGRGPRPSARSTHRSAMAGARHSTHRRTLRSAGEYRSLGRPTPGRFRAENRVAFLRGVGRRSVRRRVPGADMQRVDPETTEPTAVATE